MVEWRALHIIKEEKCCMPVILLATSETDSKLKGGAVEEDIVVPQRASEGGRDGVVMER